MIFLYSHVRRVFRRRTRCDADYSRNAGYAATSTNVRVEYIMYNRKNKIIIIKKYVFRADELAYVVVLYTDRSNGNPHGFRVKVRTGRRASERSIKRRESHGAKDWNPNVFGRVQIFFK